tara:strand:- start:167 stop:673 length:507 start_codon:yes stop_codon:yes gene_type:complete
MPNWITNEITFTHSDPHKLAEIVNIFRNDRPFNQLIPEPDWPNVPAATDIKDTAGNPVAKKGELPKKEVMKHTGGESVYWNWPSTGQQDSRWYNWRKKHFGCKWDTHDVEIDHQVANNMVHMTFLTPWGPPDGIYERLCEMGYEFMHWQWEDECEGVVHDLVPLEVVA